MTGRQIGAGSSMSVADVQNRVDAVKGIMYAALFNFTPSFLEFTRLHSLAAQARKRGGDAGQHRQDRGPRE